MTINCNFWNDPHDGKGPVREEPAAALGAGRPNRTGVRFHFGTCLWREGRRHGSTGRAHAPTASRANYFRRDEPARRGRAFTCEKTDI